MSKISLILVGALLAGGSLYAETADTTLASPGCYIGTGCDQNGWATNVAGGTELGLSAIIRNLGAPGDTNNGPANPGSISGTTYYIPEGSQPSSPTHALWNFEWSINTGTNSILNYTYLLTITDITSGLSTSFDPSVDYGPPSLTPNPLGDNTMGNFGAQNSENLNFAFLQVPLNFNDNLGDDYVITLTETSKAWGNLINSDSIDVQVVTPEPSTITMAGLSLCALWFLRRRQVRRNQA